ncbi:MAG: YbaB/EbfC family nucleoid-associated protein [Gammaproteobacteria bacterium]|nr:MAG: YbaB/EbfC family nucleoid-associated protein [Gammaproteobacteria bacterium]
MMKGGLGNIMRQAQQMQANLLKAQEELAALEVPGESGGGMVRVVMTGRYDIKRVTLDPELLKDDKEIIEDLIAAAVNDAVRKIEASSREKYAGMTGGIGLPEGFKMPF